MSEYTKALSELAGRFLEVSLNFTPDVCNSKMVQSIVFSVPDIFKYHQALEETIIKTISQTVPLGPNKNFAPINECGGSYNNGTACMRLEGHKSPCGPPIREEAIEETMARYADFTPPPHSIWYQHIAEIHEVQDLSPEERNALWDKLKIQLTHQNAGVPFRVWDGTRYNDNTYNWLKERN